MQPQRIIDLIKMSEEFPLSSTNTFQDTHYVTPLLELVDTHGCAIPLRDCFEISTVVARDGTRAVDFSTDFRDRGQVKDPITGQWLQIVDKPHHSCHPHFKSTYIFSPSDLNSIREALTHFDVTSVSDQYARNGLTAEVTSVAIAERARKFVGFNAKLRAVAGGETPAMPYSHPTLELDLAHRHLWPDNHIGAFQPEGSQSVQLLRRALSEVRQEFSERRATVHVQSSGSSGVPPCIVVQLPADRRTNITSLADAARGDCYAVRGVNVFVRQPEPYRGPWVE